MCRCGNGTNQLETISSSLAKLLAKRSMKFRGKGHLATETNGSNGLNEVQKLSKRSKEKGQKFLLHQNHLSSISLGQAVYWIWRKVTSLYDRFMETLPSQRFRECDRFTSFVQLLHLSFLGISDPIKTLLAESRILFYSNLNFFFPPIKLSDFSDSRANKRHF